MNDANAIRKRVAKYVLPVTALAFLFNFVKFFEADVSYYENWSNKTGKTLMMGGTYLVCLWPGFNNNRQFFLKGFSEANQQGPRVLCPRPPLLSN